MKIRGSVNKLSLSTVAACLAASFLLVAGFYLAKGSRLQGKSSNAPASARGASSAAAAKRNDSKLLAAYGKLPLTFMENQGQTAQEVRYVSHGSGYDLFLTSQEAVVALRSGKHFDLSPRHRAQSLKAMHELRRSGVTTTALRMQFEGANPQAQIAGAEKLPGTVNYFVGNDSQKWRGGIPTYAQVKYTQVYPGVDLVFYGNQNKLEYDFIVAPGVDPNVIRLSLSGAEKMRVNAHGDVVVTVPGGAVALQKPLVYQNIDGQRREIAGRYALKGDRLSFAVASYDRRQPLIVDPILNYSTYVGGGDEESTGYGLAVDGNGNAYISGQTLSTDFPTKNPLATTGGTNSGNAAGQAFVTELSASGALVFSTYLGGTAGGDAAFGIALDPSGNIYVTGETVSIDFPTTSNALKQSPLPSNAVGTSFLTKLTSAGALSYSSYIGGTNNDFGNAVAADASGNAYITGTTASAPGTTAITFPVTTDAYQSTLGNAQGNAFLTRIDTTQSGNNSLIYSTYLGGDDAYEGAAGFPDEGFGIAVDTTQHAFIGGVTASANFPTNGTVAAHQAAALNTTSSAFVAEFDTTAGTLLYSSYLGGSGGAGGGDFGAGVDLLSGTSKVYITGVTNSLSDFGPPTTGAYQTTGDADAGAAFVAVTDTSSGALDYCTYLGSSGTTGWSIKADAASGNALVGGGTSSTTLPVTMGAYQTSLAAGAPGDGFIAEIGPNGNGSEDLGYLSYFGGSGSGANPDQIFGIAIGTLPTVYVAGQTYSINLPSTTGNSLDGDSDAFVASLTLNAPALTISATTLSFNSTAVGTAAPTQTLTLTNNTNSAITFTSATATTTTPALATDFSATTACTSIPALGTCTIVVGYTPSVSTAEAGTLSIVDGAGTQMVALTGTVGAASGFTLTAQNTMLMVTQGQSASETITVTSVGTFAGTVDLACTGQPKNSKCMLSSKSVTLTAGSSTPITLDFEAQSRLAPPPMSPRFPQGPFRIVAPVALVFMVLLLFASQQRLRTRFALASALLVFVALAGCSRTSTTVGTYPLTITGTSSGATTQTVTVTVVVAK